MWSLGSRTWLIHTSEESFWPKDDRRPELEDDEWPEDDELAPAIDQNTFAAIIDGFA